MSQYNSCKSEKKFNRLLRTAYNLSEDTQLDEEMDFSSICTDLHDHITTSYQKHRTWLKASSLLLAGAAKVYYHAADDLMNDAAKLAIFGHKTGPTNNSTNTTNNDNEEHSNDESEDSVSDSQNFDEWNKDTDKDDTAEESYETDCTGYVTIRKRLALVPYEESDTYTEALDIMFEESD